MILDTSAVVAMARREDMHHWLFERLNDADSVAIGAPTLVETEIVLTWRLGTAARGDLSRFIQKHEVLVVAFDEKHWGEAGSAFLRFGKGRHPAGLNFGDCMTYATARLAAEPLLCLGGDFALTDLDVVHA